MRFPTRLRDSQHRPIVAISLSLPGRRPVLFDALVDTGADLTLFPNSVARRLGIQIPNNRDGIVTAAVGGESHYWTHDLTLEFRRMPESYQWHAQVGFVDRPMTYGILGAKSFFEFFDMSYSLSQRTIEINPVSAIVTKARPS